MKIKKLFFILVSLPTIMLFVCQLSAQASEENVTVSIRSRLGQMSSFPCSKCHQNYAPGVVTISQPREHRFLASSFHHMPQVKECRICHSYQNTDSLNLLDGTIVAYDQMNLVCKQCHGRVEREWQLGLHGRQWGQWNGAQSRVLCGECHNPHSPKFKPMQTVADPFKSGHVINKEETPRE